MLSIDGTCKLFLLLNSPISPAILSTIRRVAPNIWGTRAVNWCEFAKTQRYQIPIRYQSDTNLTTISYHFTIFYLPFPWDFPMDFPMDFPASKGDQGLTTPSSPKSSRGGRMRHRLAKSVRHPGMGVLLGFYLHRKPMGFYQIYRVFLYPLVI